jgi:hypothetical protein
MACHWRTADQGYAVPTRSRRLRQLAGASALRPVEAASVVVGLALGFASLAVTVAAGVPQPRLATLFLVMVFIGELIRVNLPHDLDTAPLGGSAAVGYSLLLQSGPHGADAATHSAYAVIAVVTVASLSAVLVQALLGRDARPGDVARRVLVTSAVAAVFRGSGLRTITPTSVAGWRFSEAGLPVVAMVIAVLIGGALDVLLGALMRAERDRSPFVPTLRNQARASLGIGLSMAATGMLMALALPLIGMWALAVIAIPLAVTQFSFRRYAAIRRTYRQTIRALSRVTEVGGYVEPGHSRRVSRLAVAVGREFGMTDSELVDLEYAALMHDIGQLSLAEAIPRGSTLRVPPAERRRIAELGAEVVRSTGSLERVATIVATQAHPYRKMRETEDAEVPLEARIIRAASAYDDLVSAAEAAGGARWNALERLRMGMAYEYDPRVVEALTTVLEKSGEI